MGDGIALDVKALFDAAHLTLQALSLVSVDVVTSATFTYTISRQPIVRYELR
jgi:hypothetical protein